MNPRRAERLSYDVSIYRKAGAVQYYKDRRCIGNVYPVLFDIRVYVIVGAEAAKWPKKMETLELISFPIPHKSRSTYLEVAFCMLGFMLLS